MAQKKTEKGDARRKRRVRKKNKGGRVKVTQKKRGKK